MSFETNIQKIYICALIKNGQVSDSFHIFTHRPDGKPSVEGTIWVLVKETEVDTTAPAGWDWREVAAKGYQEAMEDVTKRAAALRAKLLEQYNMCLALELVQAPSTVAPLHDDDDITF